jgi:hypothetical protein
MIQTLTESRFVRIALAATVLLSMGLAAPAAAAHDAVDAGGADSTSALVGGGADVVTCDNPDIWDAVKYVGGCDISAGEAFLY